MSACQLTNIVERTPKKKDLDSFKKKNKKTIVSHSGRMMYFIPLEQWLEKLRNLKFLILIFMLLYFHYILKCS